MDFLSRMLKGLVVGVANIIPGVSGGTMAVVMGIYDKLIGAVSDLRRDFKNSVIYLFPIGVGALLGILLFSYLIEYLLANFTMPTNIFFLGLILGSIPMIAKKALYQGKKLRVGVSNVLPGLITLGAMIVMAVMGTGDQSATEMTGSYFSAIRLFLSAVAAAACMIMPGISGSMIMVLLGVYTSVLTAISSFNIPVLIPVALGVLLGVFWGAKLIDWCMKRFEQQTYFAILGLIAGSILPILLNAGYTPGLHTLLSLIALIAGAAIAFWMSRMDGQQG